MSLSHNLRLTASGSRFAICTLTACVTGLRMIVIKHRQTQKVLLSVDAKTLEGSKFAGSKLQGANLAGADLSGADLTYCDLRSADLSGGSSGAEPTSRPLVC